MCLLLQDLLQSCARGGGGEWRTCAGTREEPGTLTQGAPVFPGSSRLGIEPKTPGGTREEPGTLTQGAPVFPGSSRLGIEPKTPGWT